MRYELTSKQISYFQEHEEILFASLLSEKKLNAAKEYIEKSCKDFLLAHDLFRKDPLFLSIAKDKAITSTISTLIKRPAFRLLLDQVLLPAPEVCSYYTAENLYQLSCMQGALMGAIIKLTEGEVEGFSIEAGSILFFSARKEIDLKKYLDYPDHTFLLLVYGKTNSRYILNEKDPFTHELKREGYAFGDLLKDTTHPTIRP